MSVSVENKIDVIPVPISRLAQESGFLGQGLLVAYAAQWGGGVLQEFYNFHQVEMFVPADIPRIKTELVSREKPAIYLFTDYDWTHQINVDVARLIREISPGSINMVGGPSVPGLVDEGKKFINQFQCFDLAVMAEGEETFAELLHAIAFRSIVNKSPIRSTDYSGIRGVLWRSQDKKPVRNESRPQIKDVNTIPSPYLSGVFKEPFAQSFIAYTETNRGCPFSCSYCDWGSSTQSKFRLFNEERVRAEMEWISSRKFLHYYPTDSNFGAFERDVEFAKYAVSLKKTTGYPQSFATNYAKNVADRVVDIAEILFEGKMLERFSVPFQTIDKETLENVDRDNIKISAFDRMVSRLRSKWIPTTTEVLLGLPGQNYEKFKIDLQYFFDRLINPTVYLVSVLPNAPMARPEYIEKYSLKISNESIVIATSTFTEADRQRMIDLRLAGMFFIHEKFLIYYLIYCQLELGIKALDIVDAVLGASNQERERYPIIAWVFDNMMECHTETGSVIIGWSDKAKYLFENIRSFYLEINSLVQEKFHVVVEGEELEALIALQAAIVDRVNKKLPLSVSVSHDVVAYFAQLKDIPVFSVGLPGGNFRPLREFLPGNILIPEQRKKRHYSFKKVTTEKIEWPFFAQDLFV